MDAGAVPIFVHLLSSPHDNVQEQAIWALGNIAGDSTELRNFVLNQGILPPLLTILTNAHRLSMTQNAVWALSNLCRGKNPPVDFAQVNYYSTLKAIKSTYHYYQLKNLCCFSGVTGTGYSRQVIVPRQWRRSVRCLLGNQLLVRWAERKNSGTKVTKPFFNLPNLIRNKKHSSRKLFM